MANTWIKLSGDEFVNLPAFKKGAKTSALNFNLLTNLGADPATYGYNLSLQGIFLYNNGHALPDTGYIDVIVFGTRLFYYDFSQNDSNVNKTQDGFVPPLSFNTDLGDLAYVPVYGNIPTTPTPLTINYSVPSAFNNMSITIVSILGQQIYPIIAVTDAIPEANQPLLIELPDTRLVRTQKNVRVPIPTQLLPTLDDNPLQAFEFMIGSIEITNGGQLLPTKGRLVLTIDNQFGRDGADVSFFIYNFIDRPMTSAKFGIGNSQGYISLRPFYSTSPFITKDLLITYDFGDSKNVNNMIIKFSDVFALRTNYPLIYSDPVGFPLNTWIRLKTNVVVPLNVNMAVEPEPGRFGGRAYSDPLPFLKLGPKFALSLSKLTIGNNGRALPSRGFVQIGIDGINNPDGSVAFFYRYDFSSTSSQKNLNNVLGDIVYSLLQNNGNKRLVVYYSYVDFFDVANMSLNIGSIFGQNLI